MAKHDAPPVAVEIARSGRWWAISVPSMPNVFSQCRRLEQVDEFAREAIALASGCRPDEVGPVAVHVTPPDDVASLITDAHRAAQAAQAAQAAAATARRTAVAALVDRGYPTRDIGALLGISHQRVSQLLAETASSAPMPPGGQSSPSTTSSANCSASTKQTH